MARMLTLFRFFLMPDVERREKTIQLFVPTKTSDYPWPHLHWPSKRINLRLRNPYWRACCPDGSKSEYHWTINSPSFYPESSGVVPAAFCPRSISASGRSSHIFGEKVGNTFLSHKQQSTHQPSHCLKRCHLKWKNVPLQFSVPPDFPKKKKVVFYGFPELCTSKSAFCTIEPLWKYVFSDLKKPATISRKRSEILSPFKERMSLQTKWGVLHVT